MLEEDLKKHNEKYKKRLLKLENNRQSLLDVTGLIEQMIAGDIDHEDRILQVYSAENLGEI